MEKFDTLYFKWESGPAVLVPVGEGDLGYFIPPDDGNWRLATPSQIADFFVDGIKLSKSDFENTFGVIGESLPDLPESPVVT